MTMPPGSTVVLGTTRRSGNNKSKGKEQKSKGKSEKPRVLKPPLRNHESPALSHRTRRWCGEENFCVCELELRFLVLLTRRIYLPLFRPL
jgi:hypothetical protein